jgi:long-chain fatty acid transport protein
MLNTPYGSSIKWGDDWRGAHLIQDISLKLFNIQPTVSWKITNRLSVGAGLMMEYGNFNLNRALIAPGAMSGLANKLYAANPALATLIPQELKAVIAKYDNASAASAGLTGDAGTRLGYNLGVMYDVNDKITIGASYRSKVTAKVKEGEVDVKYANELEFKELLKSVNNLLSRLPQGTGVPSEIEVPSLDKGTFSAELPLPSVLKCGYHLLSDKQMDRFRRSAVQRMGHLQAADN